MEMVAALAAFPSGRVVSFHNFCVEVWWQFVYRRSKAGGYDEAEEGSVLCRIFFLHL